MRDDQKKSTRTIEKKRRYTFEHKLNKLSRNNIRNMYVARKFNVYVAAVATTPALTAAHSSDDAHWLRLAYFSSRFIKINVQ